MTPTCACQIPVECHYPLTWPKKPEAGCEANFFRELILPIKMNPLKEEMLFWCYILFSNYYIIVSGVKSEVVWHVLMLQGNWDGTKNDMIKVKVYVRVVVTKMQRCKTLLFCDFFFYYYLSLKVGIITLKLCKIQVLKLSQAGVLWVENSLLPLDQH